MFVDPKSTSNLQQPSFERFKGYLERIHLSQQFSNRGPLVLELEARLANLHHSRFCITFCSGFYALVALLKLLSDSGSRVLLPSLTYRRMPDILKWANKVPVYVDVSPDNYALTSKIIQNQNQHSFDIVLAPHPIVNSLDSVGLESTCRNLNKPIIFDSVESVYETTSGKKIGSFGIGEVFSLHACKLINGFGGGYVTTNSSVLAERLKNITKFGFSINDDTLDQFGCNLKLNEFHAALALANLDELEQQIASNKRKYNLYREYLNVIAGCNLIEFDESEKCSYKNIVIALSEKWPFSIADTVTKLNQKNILARRYYFPPLHNNSDNRNPVNLPITEKIGSRLINLPCGAHVCESDIKLICQELSNISILPNQVLR